MAWNYDYPYVDATQTNDDWFLGLAKRVEVEINGVDGIKATANEAKALSENAKNIADVAKDASLSATNIANESLGISTSANTTADSAVNTANNALEKASTAETTAKNADTKTTNLSNKISGYDSRFTEIDAKILNNTSSIALLKIETENLSNDTKALHTEVETNTSNITDNTRSIGALEDKDLDLETRVAKLETVRPGQNFSSVNIYKGAVDTQFTYPSSWVTCASIMQVEPLVELDDVRNNTTVHCRFVKKRTTKLNNNTIYGLGSVKVSIEGSEFFACPEGTVSNAYTTAIPVACALLKGASTGTPTLGGIGTGIVFVDDGEYTPIGNVVPVWGFRLLTQSFMDEVTECDGFIVEFSYYNTEGGLVSVTE